MGIRIVLPSFLENSTSGSDSTGHSHSNLAVLNKLSANGNGELLYNRKNIGEKAIEIGYNIILNSNQSIIELPDDCDISRAITLSLNGVMLQKDEFWEVIEKEWPNKDTIALKGLDFQANDNIFITYYRKV